MPADEIAELLAEWGPDAVLLARPLGGAPVTWGDPDVVVPLASVSKPITALACLVAVEEGTLELDEPAGPPGSTVRHLLAHASGLAPGERSALAPPGTRRIYSNAGFEVLADHLATRAGMPWETYVREAVVVPLGMSGTVVEGSSGAGFRSSARDLGRLVAELQAPRLIAPTTLAEATTEQFPGLDGVLPGFGAQHPNPWGLGLELRDGKSPHWTGSRNSPATFGHFGASGTSLWVDPEVGLGLVGLGTRAFGPWAAELWPRIADVVIGLLSRGGEGRRPG